jgi:hypothetical protein
VSALYNEIDPFAAAWATGRLGKLRGYGNAIVAEQAAAFVRAVIATMGIA